MNDGDMPITKEWLESIGAHASKSPDRRKSEQCTEYNLVLPRHLHVIIHYWEYPKSDCRDGWVVSTATYGGGPLRIPSEVMKTRLQLCRLIECLCGVNLMED